MSWPSSAFWDFSAHLYRRPGVEAACLGVQERGGFDVNLVLWALWLGSRGTALDSGGRRKALDAVASWQDQVVRPLRLIRRHLRGRLDRGASGEITTSWPEEAGRLRQGVLALELDGEHLAQLALGRLGETLKRESRPGPALAAANLARLGAFGHGDRADLLTLVESVFPDWPADEIQGAVKAMISS